MAFNIVLIEPVIPQNTGSIARMTAATYCPLHLIEPLGFSLEDRYLKRAGLDYWPETNVSVHKSWEEFLSFTAATREQIWFFSKYAKNSYLEASFKDGDYLIFGNETVGFKAYFHEEYADRRFRIPMENPNVRSLNLASAAAIVLYEARRQIGTIP